MQSNVIPTASRDVRENKFKLHCGQTTCNFGYLFNSVGCLLFEIILKSNYCPLTLTVLTITLYSNLILNLYKIQVIYLYYSEIFLLRAV